MSIRDISGNMLIENSIISPNQTRVMVHLQDKYITYADIDALTDKNIRATRGTFFIKYDKVSKFRNNKFPYIVGTDLMGFKVRVSGLRHFLAMTKELPEFAWILRNTNFTPAYFKLAKTHIGIQIPFSINAGAYAERVYADAEAQGYDPQNLPNGVLVSFRCAQDREKEFKKIAPAPRTKLECASELKRAEAQTGKEEEIV